MTGLIWLASGTLLLAGSGAGAQSMPPVHSQHHVAKHSASMRSTQCEHDMHQMMSMMQQMMKMHEGMKMQEGMNKPHGDGMNMPMQSTKPGENPPTADPHQH